MGQHFADLRSSARLSLLSPLERWTMELGRFSLSLTIAGIGTLTIASMLIWLLLYEPVALAGALDQGDLSVVAQALGTALLKTVAALFRYL